MVTPKKKIYKMLKKWFRKDQRIL